MAFSEVASRKATTEFEGVDSATLAFGGNVTSGNLLVVSGNSWTDPVAASYSISDTRSTSYTTYNGTTRGTFAKGFLSWGLASSSGACTVTVNPAGGTSWGSFSINEYTAGATISLDVNGGESTGSSTSPSDGLTTTASAGLIAGGLNFDPDPHYPGSVTITPGGSYTQVGEIQSCLNAPHSLVHRITSSGAAYTVDWTLGTSGTWSALTAAWKETSTGYTLTADAGSFTVTGTAANLVRGLKVAADAGSYSVTGTAANLLRGYKLAANTTAYSLTGTDVTFLRGYKLAGDVGSYAVNGTAATLARSYLFAADAGEYLWTGTDADLRKGRTLAADAGVYAWTGTDASLLSTRTLAVDAGSYAWTGTDAALTYTPDDTGTDDHFLACMGVGH